jgi:hypothetical protein
MDPLAIQSLSDEWVVWIKQRVRHLAWSTIIGPGARIDLPAIESGDEPLEFVELGVVDGVAGVDHKVDTAVRHVQLIDGPDDPVEQLRSICFMRPPRAGRKVLAKGCRRCEPGGRLLIHDLGVAQVHESRQQLETIRIDRLDGFIGEDCAPHAAAPDAENQ